MAHKLPFVQFIFAALVVLSMNTSLLAAWGGTKAPTGQMCPLGSYVIGFDSETNIICTEACGNGVVNPGETCDDGNTVNGDSCPATCQTDTVKPEAAIAAEAIPVDTGISQPVAKPIISGVKPAKLTYGSRELTMTISGTGFSADSVIIFDGTRYTPSVNQTGTQLKVTIPTRDLNMGPYAITVSNGPGKEIRRKRALEIY